MCNLILIRLALIITSIIPYHLNAIDATTLALASTTPTSISSLDGMPLGAEVALGAVVGVGALAVGADLLEGFAGNSGYTPPAKDSPVRKKLEQMRAETETDRAVLEKHALEKPSAEATTTRFKKMARKVNIAMRVAPAQKQIQEHAEPADHAAEHTPSHPHTAEAEKKRPPTRKIAPTSHAASTHSEHASGSHPHETHEVHATEHLPSRTQPHSSTRASAPHKSAR